MNRTITVPEKPLRIISLVPSQTELLFDLGLDDTVVGITKFCIHPDSWFRSKTRVGGTKQVHTDRVDTLQPDLIIANKEENMQPQIEALAAKYPVWISDIHTLPQALDMIAKVGELVNRAQKAQELIQQISNGFEPLKPAPKPLRVAYFIWYNPWMSVGHDTFIADMLGRCGWTNVFDHLNRYPEITIDTLKEANPDVILLSSEPFPFKEKHVAELQAVLPAAKIILVDGEMFSWYGSRLLHAADYLQNLVNQLS